MTAGPLSFLFEQLRGIEQQIDDPEKKQQLEVTLQSFMASSFASPYPPPEVIRAYGQVVPGLDRTWFSSSTGRPRTVSTLSAR